MHLHLITGEAHLVYTGYRHGYRRGVRAGGSAPREFGVRQRAGRPGAGNGNGTRSNKGCCNGLRRSQFLDFLSPFPLVIVVNVLVTKTVSSTIRFES